MERKLSRKQLSLRGVGPALWPQKLNGYKGYDWCIIGRPWT